MAKRPVAKTKKKTPAKAVKAKTVKAKAGKPAAKPKAVKAKTKAKSAKVKSGSVTVNVPRSITLDLPPTLHDRLRGLSRQMGLSVEGVIRQALGEFVETWEDHHRTVSALAEGSDRVQLSIKD